MFMVCTFASKLYFSLCLSYSGQMLHYLILVQPLEEWFTYMGFHYGVVVFSTDDDSTHQPLHTLHAIHCSATEGSLSFPQASCAFPSLCFGPLEQIPLV